MTVNFEAKQTQKYFNTAYQGTQGYLVLCAIPQSGGALLTKGVYHTSESDRLLEKAESLNGNYHLYTNIHPLRKAPATGRGKEADVKGVCLFATDVDAKDFISDPEEKAKAIKEKGDYKWTDELLTECKKKALAHINDVCSEVDVPPSALIDSGHGYYPVFFLDQLYEFGEPIEKDGKEVKVLKLSARGKELKEVNRILHKALNADSTFDFARILRIPGTMNLKPGYPCECKLIEFNPDRRYTIDDIRKFGKLVKDTAQIEMSPDKRAHIESAKPPTEVSVSEAKENEKATPDKPTNKIDLEPILNLVSAETRSMIDTGKWGAGKKTKDGKAWSRSERDQCVIGRLKVDGATYKQVKAIFTSYAVGDKYREANNGSRYLKRCWDRVSTEKTKKDKKPQFHATPLAIELCRNRNENLAYVTEQDQFYGYKDGVWKIITDGYVEKAIRDLIRPKFSDWDSKTKRNEVLSALKDHLTSWESKDRFDAGINPDLQMINLSNGMLDWKTGELKSHNKSYYSTCQLNVTYEEEAKSELWERSLVQWIPDPKSRLFMQEFAGYCLIPDTKYHRAVILVGAGKNGKSTYLFALENLFGKDNLSSIPMKKLSERFEIALIQHKLVNICADIDSGYIEQTSNIKKIISGDTLRGELKYKPSFDFTPITRLWFSCNEIPKASDRSEAWYRRFEYVTFPNCFEGDDQDSQLKYKLTTQEVLSAVLNWSIEGLRRLEKQGDFTISDLMTETKEYYELENDNVAAFIDEMITFPVDCSVPKTWLYQHYVDFCKEGGTKSMSRKRFVTRIKANGFEEQKTSIKVCSLHHNFRCQETDKYGNYICESDSSEYVRRHCFFGMDLED